MFIKKKELNRINKELSRLSDLEEEREPPDNYHSCDVCGCLLGEKAFKGKGMLLQRFRVPDHAIYLEKEDYIYYPYYCWSHKPKGKKK